MEQTARVTTEERLLYGVHLPTRQRLAQMAMDWGNFARFKDMSCFMSFWACGRLT
jgi:hypothetical protein